MIFDRLAPQTPAVQREQFLSLLAPFAVVGAAFVIHTNMDPRWRVPSLWAVVVALLVKVLWLRSFMPMHAGFSSDNAITLIDALGETITVPFQISISFELWMLSQILGDERRSLDHYIRAELDTELLRFLTARISWNNSLLVKGRVADFNGSVSSIFLLQSKYITSIPPPVTPRDVEIGGHIYEMLYGALLTDKNYTVLKDPLQYMSYMYSGLFCMFVEVGACALYARCSSLPTIAVVNIMQVPEYLFPFKDIVDVARSQHSMSKDEGIQGPMTVLGQLTLEMASMVDALITGPSLEYVRRWDNIFERYSSNALLPDDTELWDWLFKQHRKASRVLRETYADDR
ncbi:hypothetical protein PENSPDRAFT_759566 [Peniophora sp. CONT]|nr:hypothetical protein PENSPDRAFT_759566 [Peniophora sp. CONT]